MDRRAPFVSGLVSGLVVLALLLTTYEYILNSVQNATATVVMATAVTAATLLTLDLLWLGVVARPLYDTALGLLKRPVLFWPAAGLFYALYIGAIVVHAELGAVGVGDAARRGAGLGLVAYGTYELTNWAVLHDWPAALVLPDGVLEREHQEPIRAQGSCECRDDVF